MGSSTVRPNADFRGMLSGMSVGPHARMPFYFMFWHGARRPASADGGYRRDSLGAAIAPRIVRIDRQHQIDAGHRRAPRLPRKRKKNKLKRRDPQLGASVGSTLDGLCRLYLASLHGIALYTRMARAPSVRRRMPTAKTPRRHRS